MARFGKAGLRSLRRTPSHRSIRLFVLLVGCLAILAPSVAGAASVYSNWQKVEEIRYYANGDFYLVSFVGGPWALDAECSDANYDYAIVAVDSQVGVDVTAEERKSLIQELQVARALDLRVRAWVFGCLEQPSSPGVIRPKLYTVWSKE